MSCTYLVISVGESVKSGSNRAKVGKTIILSSY